MNGPVEKHRLAAFSALRPVRSTRHIDPVPALTKLTSDRRFFLSRHCFGHPSPLKDHYDNCTPSAICKKRGNAVAVGNPEIVQTATKICLKSACIGTRN
jgi:hypothetical protein